VRSWQKNLGQKNKGIPQNLWVKKLGLCPRPQDFQGMAPVSKGVG